MKILQVASEAVPLCKTGGLADVVTALSQTLASQGDDVRVLIPAYAGVLARVAVERHIELGDPLGVGHRARVCIARVPDSPLEWWLLQCDPLFDRPGGPYGDPSGVDWPDNHLRFGLLARAAAMLAIGGAALGHPVDVVHTHDWQAALAAGYLAWWGRGRPASVLTVHNLQFAGRFALQLAGALALPPAAVTPAGLEFYGELSLLKAGLVWADRVTTVSPTYADEIRTPEGGIGFDGLLRHRGDAVVGILNGIDEATWDPRHDAALPARFDANHLEDKQRCRAALQRELGLAPQTHAPVLGLVGRLTWQKGIDLVLEAVEVSLAQGAQLVVLGSGEPALEQALDQLVALHPLAVAHRRGYDEALSHRIFAGADLFLVPSRFEPCGLTQMYAMRYGTPPVVRRTGGLADTVIDEDERPGAGSGFVFDAPTAPALAAALQRATSTWRDRAHHEDVQRRGMARAFGWREGAGAYRRVYREAIAHRDAEQP